MGQRCSPEARAQRSLGDGILSLTITLPSSKQERKEKEQNFGGPNGTQGCAHKHKTMHT